MFTRTNTVGLASLVAATLLAAACSEPVGPNPRALDAPRFAVMASGIALDQWNGTMRESGTMLIKGFNPTNPHVGDAVVATFFWAGSKNIIDSVTDVLTTNPYTRVGNPYALVQYVTSGGLSMATYVATNVQNFPDGITDSAGGNIYAVRANLSQTVTDGGVLLSAYTGVNPVWAQALGARHSAAGSGSTATTADPGAIAIGAGALAYGVSMSGLYGVNRPAGFTPVATMSDAVFNTDGEYTVTSAAGSIDPQWTWFFDSPGTWLASVVALNPAQQHLGFTVQPTTTLPLMAIQPPVRVTVVDDLGNTVTGFTGSVTVAIGHNGGLVTPGTLSGTKTVAAVNGVATFSDLTIDQPGNGYTLVVTAAGVTGAESAAFNIGAF